MVILKILWQQGRRVILHYRRKYILQGSHYLGSNNSINPTNKLSQGHLDQRLVRGAGLGPSPGTGVVRRLVYNFLRRVNTPPWGLAVNRRYFGQIVGNASPYFALVGVYLGAHTPDKESFTAREEIEAVCGDIREAISRAGWIHNPSFWRSPKTQESFNDPHHVYSIGDFELGPVIDKGCNAVVYAAKCNSNINENRSQQSSPSSSTTTDLESTENVKENINLHEGFNRTEDAQQACTATHDIEQHTLPVTTVQHGASLPVQESNSTLRLEDIHPADLSKKSDFLAGIEFPLDSAKVEQPITRTGLFRSSLLQKNEDKKRKVPIEEISSDLRKESLKSYPLAIKMMFNYDAESNFGAILTSMHREVLPASYVQISEDYLPWKRKFVQERQIPTHPNVVDMPCVFVDMVPMLPEGTSMYPNALPKRLHTEGFGRNMSMFCVMKRYDCTLGEYLVKYKPDARTALLLLTQLLEAVLHINSCDVVHRDLKLDNILLSLSEGLNYPKLVITDFGCCFADQSAQLRAPFSSYETDPRLGNAALMAPEVKNAVPGLLRTIDYTRNDLWTVGVIALELFGVQNPFYSRGRKPAQLDSASYKDSQIPKLPKGILSSVRHLVMDLLRSNPKQRPSPTVAATICQLSLWAPTKWCSRSSVSMPTDKEVTQWLLCVSTKVLCEAGGSSRRMEPHVSNQGDCKGGNLEYEIVSSFLSRVHYGDVLRSLKWIRGL